MMRTFDAELRPSKWGVGQGFDVNPYYFKFRQITFKLTGNLLGVLWEHSIYQEE